MLRNQNSNIEEQRFENKFERYQAEVNAQVNRKFALLFSHIQEQSSKLQEQSLRIEQLETRVFTLEDENRQLQEKNVRLQAELRGRIQEIKNLKDGIKEERLAWVKEKNILLASINDLRNSNNDLISSNNNLVTRVASLENENHVLKVKNEELEAKVAELTREVSELKERVTRLETMYRSVVHAIKDKMSNAVAKLMMLSGYTDSIDRAAQIANANSIIQICDASVSTVETSKGYEVGLYNLNSLAGLVKNIEDSSKKLSNIDVLSQDLKERLDSVVLEAENVIASLVDINQRYSDDEVKKYEEYTKTLLFNANHYSAKCQYKNAESLLGLANKSNQLQCDAAFKPRHRSST